jgi:hypothetical protein
MTHNTWKVSLALTVLTLAGLAAPAPAQHPVPFRGTYTAKNSITPTAIPGVLRVQDAGSGHALHLGNSTVTDDLLLDARVVPSPVSGTITFTAANGDQVFAKVTAAASPPDSEGLVRFTGGFVITGGTGRFRGATGGAVLQGINNAAAMTTDFAFSGAMSAPGAGRRK